MRFNKMVVTASLLLASLQVSAENIGQALGNESQSSGYFQLGLIGGWVDSPLEGRSDAFGGVVIEGRYQWHGLFIEATSDSIGVPGFAIGYELWQNQDWAIDIVSIPGVIGFDPNDFDRLANKGLRDRTDDASTVTGIRATHFYEDYVFQAHLLPIGRGTIAALAAGRHWQLENWNITALVAMRYNSDDINKIWSVQANEASDAFPEYTAGSGLSFGSILRAEYPITENWVFESSVFYNKFSDAIADSPLNTQDFSAGLTFEISYVF